MNIGFISSFNFKKTIGGVENHILFLSKELQTLGCNVTIFIITDSKNKTHNNSTFNNIRVVEIGLPILSIFQYCRKISGIKYVGNLFGLLYKMRFVFHASHIATLLKEYNCDIYHQHDFLANVLTMKKIKEDNSNIMLTNHTGEYLLLNKTIIGRIALRYIMKLYDAVIGPSSELTPVKYSIKSFTIFNGVNESFFRFSAQEIADLKKTHGIKENQFVILCPRRWAPTKGIIYLVESMIKYEYDEKFVFIFAGDDYPNFPKYTKKINTLLSEPNLKANIIRLGSIDISKLNKYYNLSDVVIIPSIMEAVSLAALESMATGTPVISTNVGGMPELISNDVNGILINPKNPHDIYNSIIKIENDSALYENIIQNGLDTAKLNSWYNVALKTHKIYQEL